MSFKDLSSSLVGFLRPGMVRGDCNTDTPWKEPCLIILCVCVCVFPSKTSFAWTKAVSWHQTRQSHRLESLAVCNFLGTSEVQSAVWHGTVLQRRFSNVITNEQQHFIPSRDSFNIVPHITPGLPILGGLWELLEFWECCGHCPCPLVNPWPQHKQKKGTHTWMHTHTVFPWGLRKSYIQKIKTMESLELSSFCFGSQPNYHQIRLTLVGCTEK